MSTFMKQVVLESPKTFQFKETEIPTPKEGEALLKIKAVGICGSDIHTYFGKHPFVHPPLILGHEASGEIVSFGPGDHSGLSVGDRVVIRPQRTCGKCRPCREGRYNICEKLNVLGCLSDGASSEYFAVETSILYKIPDYLSFAEGNCSGTSCSGRSCSKARRRPCRKKYPRMRRRNHWKCSCPGCQRTGC